jgi:hypothetical protein
VLHGVLRLLLGGEHVPAERQDRAVVAVVDDLERDLVAAPDLVDQALVAERREHPP